MIVLERHFSGFCLGEWTLCKDIMITTIMKPPEKEKAAGFIK